MGSKQSVQFLASQLMGLGDRFRSQAQSEQSNALAKRYAAIAEGKFNEEKRQADVNFKETRLQQAADIEAVNIIKELGQAATAENILAARPEALRRVGIANPSLTIGRPKEMGIKASGPYSAFSPGVGPSLPKPAVSPLMRRRIVPTHMPTPSPQRLNGY